MKIHLLPITLSLFIPASVTASSVFVFNPADPGVINASDFSFSSAGVSSVTTTDVFLLNSPGGRTAAAPFNANLNPNGFAVDAIISISNVVTSTPATPWSMTFRGISSSGNNNSNNHPNYGGSTFGLQGISGGVLSFDLQVDYINSSGTPAGFAAAPDNVVSPATTIFDIAGNGGTGGITASVSTLDAAGNTIPTDYLDMNLNTVTATGGVVTGSISANGDRFNLQSFDDGDTNNSNDFFSSVVASISGAGGTTLDDNSFTISLDSQIIAEDGVVIPEPSALALLGLGSLCILRRRKRA